MGGNYCFAYVYDTVSSSCRGDDATHNVSRVGGMIMKERSQYILSIRIQKMH